VAVHRRERVSDNMRDRRNVALIASRQRSLGSEGWANAFATTGLIESCSMSNKTKEINYLFPLWLYPRTSDDLLESTPKEKIANLAPEFIAALTQAIGTTPSPEDTLAYTYAILYAPSYRTRYADFLKRDFPRVPLITNRELFDALVEIGRELIALHTMQATLSRITGFPVPGSNEVVKVRFTPLSQQKGVAPDAGDAPAHGESHPPRRAARAFAVASPFVPKGEESAAVRTGEDAGRVWINDAQYFDGVPESVWDMHIGGYRVAEKWLKDRKGRLLSFDDIEHYQHVIAALARTLALQFDLDACVKQAGGWPLH